jgi:hypothetical protein
LKKKKIKKLKSEIESYENNSEIKNKNIDRKLINIENVLN